MSHPRRSRHQASTHLLFSNELFGIQPCTPPLPNLFDIFRVPRSFWSGYSSHACTKHWKHMWVRTYSVPRVACCCVLRIAIKLGVQGSSSKTWRGPLDLSVLRHVDVYHALTGPSSCCRRHSQSLFYRQAGHPEANLRKIRNAPNTTYWKICSRYVLIKTGKFARKKEETFVKCRKRLSWNAGTRGHNA